MPSSLITILDRANQPIGSFSVEEAQHRMQTGEFAPDQLAHAEGLTEWTPLATVIAYVQSQVPPLPPPVSMTVPISTPSFAGNVVYGGFWLRFAAYLIDTMLVSIVVYGSFALLMLMTNPQGFIHDMTTGSQTAMDSTPFWVKLVIIPIFLGIPLLYFTLMESSARQGTFGKMALGLIVTDLEGRRITRLHALGRTASKMISNLTCILLYLGYIMAGFTARKQALHDFIASTLVLRR